MTVSEIAAPLGRDDVVALGSFDSTVTLVVLNRPTVVGRFDTVLDFGGGRLALCSDGDRLILAAGSWAPHVLAGTTQFLAR